MTQPFPSPLALRVELAFGADPAGDPASWTWTDVSTDLLSQSVQITRGRADEDSHLQSSSVTVVLSNLDGDYTPDLATGLYYPAVRLGTPLRVSVLWDAVWHVRFVGEVAEWHPIWPYGDLSDEENDEPGEAQIQIVASGVTRRLGRLPSQSAMRGTFGGQGSAGYRPVAYWPLEDPAGSVEFASALSGGTPASRTGTWIPASSDVVAGSAKLPVAGSGATMSAPLPAGIPTTRNTAWQFTLMLPDKPSQPVELLAQMRSSFFGADRLTLTLEGTGTILRLRVYDNTGVNTDTLTLPVTEADFYDHPYLYTIAVYAPASNVIARLNIIRADGQHEQEGLAGVGPGTKAAPTGEVTLRSPVSGTVVGHLDVYCSDDFPGGGPGAPGSSSLSAYAAEQAHERIRRLCTQAGIRITITGDASELMGAQPIAGLLELLAQCQQADYGILSEPLAPGLAYRTRSDLYNQDPALDLDAGDPLGDIVNPFAPTLDDQQTRNRVTVSLPGGGSPVTYANAEHIAEHGLYLDELQVNVASSTQLFGQASWRVGLGTWPGMRYPSLAPALNLKPELAADWLATELGDRAQVEHLPPQHPADVVDVLAQGYAETLSPSRWDVQINCSPAGPWTAFVLDDPQLGRLDSGTSALGAEVDSTATSFPVSTGDDGDLWTLDAAELPADIVTGGEQMTVTAISRASSPQTLTVIRAVNGVIKAHPVTQPVHVVSGYLVL